MAYRTVETIIKAAIREALKLNSAIPDDLLEAAVDFYNASEPIVWRAFPFHTKKIELEKTPDSNGIIVFDGEADDDEDVDVVRAVVALAEGDDGDVLVWNQDAIRSLMNGGDSPGSYRFHNIADDASGNRRIKVDVEDGVSSYKVLAFRRFLKAAFYSATTVPTPTSDDDYRTLKWKIDIAEPALIAWIADKIREWASREKTGTWAHSLNGTIKELREQEATEVLITPDCGMFADVGGFDVDDGWRKTI